MFDKIDYNKTDPKDIQFLDLKLGNICNLKCRICGSWSSSKWASELIDYYKAEGQTKEYRVGIIIGEGTVKGIEDKFIFVELDKTVIIHCLPHSANPHLNSINYY